MTNPQPLAALLASHPEECAAVVAVLAISLHLPFDQIGNALANCGCAMSTSTRFDVLIALVKAGIAREDEHPKMGIIWSIEHADRYAIALRGAAAWLRSRLSLGPRAPRYADREAIAARIAAVLDCAPSDVYLQWRSSGVVRIAVGGESLDANDIAALVKAGFEPTAEGWDVPGECGSVAEEQPK